MLHELYLLHAELHQYQSLVESTRQYIRGMLSRAHWYISVSGGKDSTVLWHLVNDVTNVPIPGAWGRYPFEPEQWPDAEDVIRKTARMISAPLYIVGMPEPVLSETGQTRSAWRREFCAAWQSFAATHEFTGHMMGLRREESRGRARLLAGRKSYRRQYDNMRVCCPLAEWSGRDIWAYLLTNDLPYLKVYTYMPNPESARSDVFTTRMRRYGVMSQVRHANLSHYNELVLAFREFMAW
jgi:predicted phosphoadenosine phosphosulfate sulfurtransferase